ncbi:MAG: geranylgeranylglycerol-phosphate geranylgeranyltransferase [Bacteroidota bacterium]|nr:geranylgeranylglycerol-phosphate geranylgeranyltransferase [Bacteroidota bacterium]
MKYYFLLTRPLNVVITILCQCIIIYGVIDTMVTGTALDLTNAILLIVSTAMLVAGGNVINDIMDVTTDKINKPNKIIVQKHITEKNAFSFYVILTVIAVISGFILANRIGKPILASIFIIIAFLLYSYANQVKKMVLVGNILLSFMVGLVVVITGIFDLFPVINEENRALFVAVMQQLVWIASIAFVLNLIREMIKDCVDVSGDKVAGRNSLPILLGRSRASKIVASISLLVVLGLGTSVVTVFINQEYMIYLIVFGLMGPLMYVSIRLWSTTVNKELNTLSTIMKVVLVIGLIAVYLNYNL